MVKKMVKDLPISRSGSRDMTGIIEDMIERKKKHFAEYTRAIMDYQITKTGDGYHLSVASTLYDHSNSEPYRTE